MYTEHVEKTEVIERIEEIRHTAENGGGEKAADVIRLFQYGVQDNLLVLHCTAEKDLPLAGRLVNSIGIHRGVVCFCEIPETEEICVLDSLRFMLCQTEARLIAVTDTGHILIYLGVMNADYAAIYDIDAFLQYQH